MELNKIKFLINSNGTYLDTILPPITANEDGRTIVQVIAPFPITDIVSVNYSIRPIQATVKGSYLVPTGKFGKDVLADDYTHFQTVADWNVFEIPINAVALEYISKYRAGLVLVSFAITQLQTPYFATNYLGLFSNTQPIPATSYNDGDYFIANEYNFTAHDITWAKGDYAYFYNGKWNKGKSVLKASTPSIELPVDPSLKDAPQLEYDEDVALLLANDLGLLTQRVSQSETDIESAENDINEIDGRVGVNETDIYNLESDVGNIKNGTTIVKKAEQDASGNVITSTYETKADVTSKLLTKVDKTQKIIGIDLQDDILLTEFKTALGNATQSVAGLLSAEDKTHLDGLVALLENSDGNNVVDTIGEILAIFNNYPEGADLVTVLAGKVDKVLGKSLVDDTQITKLEALDTQSQLDTKFDAKVDKDFTLYAELTTDLSDDDYIVVRDISNNQTKKTKVSTLRQFETDTYEYGVRYIEGQESSTLERVKIVNGEMTVGSATGLVANVGIDDEVVVNSFDNIDIFVRNRVVIGGNTFVRVNKYYIREYSANEGGTIYVYTLMCAKKLTGYRLPIRFDNGDGTEKDYAYLSAYEGYIDENGVARSISGVLPTTSISRGNSRIAARKNDGDGTNTDSLYGIKDQTEYNDLVAIPIYIEFANKNSQVGIGRGVVDLTFDANTVADSTVANTAIIANNANFEVDMTIYLSTGTYHTITQIDVDTPIAGQTTITFDGATVTPLTGVNLNPRQYKTGLTDSVVASTGFYKANDGKHPFKWRGMENVWGNIWKFVDGVKISNWYAWVSTNPAHYDDISSDVNGDYGSNWTKLSYQNALANGYTKEMGYDDRFPFARLPIEVGGGSGTYYADYYYQNSGDRTLLVGGGWDDTSSAGLTFWTANPTLSNAHNHFGFRLSYRP